MIKKFFFLLILSIFSATMYAQPEDRTGDNPNMRIDSTFSDSLAFSLDNPCTKIDSLVQYALKFLGHGYKYGATGPSVFDCSGFTSYVFKKFGISLKRSSREQVTNGMKVDRKDIRKGDLVFFMRGKGSKRRIGHVGLVISVDSNGVYKFVHASSPKLGVRIDESTRPGYANSYAGARRIVQCDGCNQAYVIPDQAQPKDTLNTLTEPVRATNVASVVTPKPQAKTVYYTVKKGDTLSHIARRYGVSVSNIKKWNRLSSDMIQINQKIKIIRYVK